VRIGARAGVDRQGVGQVLVGGQVAGKADGQLLLFGGGQCDRQGKFQPFE